jgi:formate hydrogenlyase subunit 3/multisubunit Na+/H+ antiporter MnhD subunit
LLALGYYLPLIATLFASPAPEPQQDNGQRRVSVSAWMAIPLVILGGLVIAMGIYPGPWLEAVARAGTHLNQLGR